MKKYLAILSTMMVGGALYVAPACASLAEEDQVYQQMTSITPTQAQTIQDLVETFKSVEVPTVPNLIESIGAACSIVPQLGDGDFSIVGGTPPVSATPTGIANNVNTFVGGAANITAGLIASKQLIRKWGYCACSDFAWCCHQHPHEYPRHRCELQYSSRNGCFNQ